MNRVASAINVTVYFKGRDRYVFIYSDSAREQLLRKFGRYAAHPELNFTWYDAAVLSQKVRKEMEKQG